MDPSEKRLKKEYENIDSDANSNISANPISFDDLYLWSGIILGPKDTPYEDGIFKLDIKIPKEYPFRPPKVKFITKIYHPNINSKGDICLDILRDKWTPALTIKSVLLSICSLLNSPNPGDPLVPQIAEIYNLNKERYNEIAKKWTDKYAL